MDDVAFEKNSYSAVAHIIMLETMWWLTGFFFPVSKLVNSITRVTFELCWMVSRIPWSR